MASEGKMDDISDSDTDSEPESDITPVDAPKALSKEEKFKLVENKIAEAKKRMLEQSNRDKKKQDENQKFVAFGDNEPDNTTAPPKGYFDIGRQNQRGGGNSKRGRGVTRRRKNSDGSDSESDERHYQQNDD
jgi:hypothetical protein